jgi:hypothetical protein
MKTSRKIPLILFLLALTAWAPSAAHAASVSLSWQLPSQNVDGTPIPSSGEGRLEHTRVEWGTCGSNGTFGTSQGSRTFQMPATSGVIPDLVAGTTYCFRAFVQNSYGEVSEASNIVARVIPAPVPQPPVLSSTVTIVWSFKSVGWGARLELVGVAPIGTPCGKVAIPEAGMYEIPREVVSLHTPLRGGVPVTFCG